MDHERRQFLKSLASMFVISLLPLGLNGWAGGLENTLLASAPQLKRKKLIVLFLRGAIDGLSVVIPHGDGRYYDSRPTIAIPSHGVLDLNGYFGLHPALAPVFPLWQHKTLGFVHACGAPQVIHSHFEAQNLMEIGTPEDISTPDGWMNRLLSVLPGIHTPTQAVSLCSTLPRILQGKLNAANMSMGQDALQPMTIDQPGLRDAFSGIYKGNDDLCQAYSDGQKARKQLMEDLKHFDYQESPWPYGFMSNARTVVELIHQDPNIQLVFLDLEGWDTHVHQGGVEGQLADNLTGLGAGLAKIANGLGDAYQDTVILVMSEFGRTIHENPNRGTDHGHGNVMWVMGGGIKGGVIQGQWPGLDAETIDEGRDLAVTTDYRSVITKVLKQHMGLTDEQLRVVFPTIPSLQTSLNFM